MNNSFLPCLLLALLGSILPARGEPVEPRQGYLLSFEAEGFTDGGRWDVHVHDAQGRLLYDGAFENEWQTFNRGRSDYQYAFYAPSEAKTVQVRPRDSQAKIRRLRLEKKTFDDVVINGDFSSGSLNGWSEVYNAALERRESTSVLNLEQNGYALTDFAPIAENAEYRVVSKQSGWWPQFVFYGDLRQLIQVEGAKGGKVKAPAGAAWMRVLYDTRFDHLPKYRTNEISSIRLTPGAPSSAGTSAIPPGSETKPAPAVSDAWEIALSPEADAREVHAARELQFWLHAITGRAPPLLAERSKTGIPKIFVGSTWAGEFRDDLRKLTGTDGYAVRSKGGNIFVFGARPRGTLFGAYALLERNSDIIWPRPFGEFEAFYSPAPDLKLAQADFLSIPVFRDRQISTPVSGHENAWIFHQWMARNGASSPWHLHVGNNYLAWQRGAMLGYGKSYVMWLGDTVDRDPLLLPLLDGQRVKSVWRQPCYTYPGTAATLAEKISAALKTVPGREIEYIHATIADNWTVCGCKDCLAPIDLGGGKVLKPSAPTSGKDPLFFSTRNFLMLNQVAEKLSKDFPDVTIRTHAYIFTAEPPAVPVHKNILPEFAAYPTQNLRYPILEGQGQRIGGYEPDVWKRRLEAWARLKPGALGSFGYYYPDGFNAVADTAAADFRAYASFGSPQVHTEGFPFDGEALSKWDADGIEKWAMVRLMWDPSRDPEQLRRDYITRVYGTAASHMAEFYGLVRDAWKKPPPSVLITCHTDAKTVFKQLITDQGIEDRAAALLEKAEAAATHPRARMLVKRHRQFFNSIATDGRIAVPYVEEATAEWRDTTSPHWEKAVVIKDFRKVSDWKLRGKEPASQASAVALMHDRKYLYIRMVADDPQPGQLTVPDRPAGAVFPNGDRFEVRLKAARKPTLYLAVGPGDHVFGSPAPPESLQTHVMKGEGSWIATLAVPVAAVFDDKAAEPACQARFGRVYRGHPADVREESSDNGAGIFNNADTLWQNVRLK